jgi:hypothetical protein
MSVKWSGDIGIVLCRSDAFTFDEDQDQNCFT